MQKIFGIRHHGPGSAQSLVKALEEMQPDALLIEGPADAQDILHHVADEGLKPPVAILMYNPKQPKQAAYFPFAEFSPEWQALKWGLANRKEIIFMDLPQGIHFTLDEQERNNPQTRIDAGPADIPGADKALFEDPLGYMAGLAGYQDSERWWEITFEQREGHSGTFEAVQEMMAALRAETGKSETARTLLREAFMRKTIRKAAKAHGRIAIICGAWHGPALDDLKRFKAGDDNRLLRGIKKTGAKSTWVPWTYGRLAVRSGYGAGVVSPAWYEMLFHNREGVVIRWMSKVSQLFRMENMDASSAHAIEAVRLAETLAALRELPLPGMEEMRQAALTVFCNGNEDMMGLVEERLVIGDVMGDVPEAIPVIPFQQDLERRIKSTRMTRFRKTIGKAERELDLRQDTQLQASRLLHRLNILGIHWGEVRGKRPNFRGRGEGDFKEYWVLKWLPDFAIHIIEAGMWGNTVEEAAKKIIAHQASGATDLPQITRLVNACIKANLPGVMDMLLRVFQDRAALTGNVNHLMEAVPELVSAIRYANTRQADLNALQKQLDQIIPRICIGLPRACGSLNEEAATEMFHTIVKTDYQLSVIRDEGHTEAWLQALAKVAVQSTASSILKGAATRLLYDKEHIPQELARQRMRFNLSRGNECLEAAYWLSGFLHGSGLVLIHDPALWDVLDAWVEQVAEEDFKEMLPIIRRAFSRFPDGEKEQMLRMAKKGRQLPGNEEQEEGAVDWGGVAKGDFPQALVLLLGL